MRRRPMNASEGNRKTLQRDDTEDWLVVRPSKDDALKNGLTTHCMQSAFSCLLRLGDIPVCMPLPDSMQSREWGNANCCGVRWHK